MTEKSNSAYSIHKAGSYYEEDQTNQILRSSLTEIPVHELSGDEAVEKSFQQSMAASSMWAKQNAKTNVFLTSIIVMKSMVGVGILGIPYVARNFGVILTFVLILIVLGLGLITSGLLLKSKNLSGRSNFSTIGYSIFRHKWIIILVNFMIIFANLGVCLSELIIFGDTSSNIINYITDRNEQPWYLSRAFMILLIGLILYRLLIVKSIEKLKFVSLFAIISISTFSVLVIYNFAITSEKPAGFSYWLPEDFQFSRAMASLPTIILAYTWQFNLFPVYKGMQNPSDKRLVTATTIGFFISMALYCIVGLLGYATYGDQIQTNYLLIINPKEVGGPLYIILNSTFVLSSTFTLPVIFFGGRNNFIQLLKSFLGAKVFGLGKKEGLLSESKKKQVDQVELRKRSQKLRFYGISTVLAVLLVIGAIFIRKLGLVYNLVGSISCNAIQMGLPTLYYVALTIRVKKMRFESIFKRLFFYFICFMLLLSLLLTFLCVICEFL